MFVVASACIRLSMIHTRACRILLIQLLTHACLADASRECRLLIHKVRKVVEFIRKSPGNTKVFDESAHQAEAKRQEEAQDKADREKGMGIYNPDVAVATKARRLKHLTSDVSQRWTSTITMLFNVLLQWNHIEKVYSSRNPPLTFPLGALKVPIVHLYSVAHPFGKFVGLTQTTNKIALVPCILSLMTLFKRTLNLKVALRLHDPSQGQNEAQIDVEHKHLEVVARVTREKLAKAFEDRFRKRYALVKHKDSRQWHWDFAMFLFPPAHRRQFEYMKVLLDVQDADEGDVVWNFADLQVAVEAKVLQLMIRAETKRRRLREEAIAKVMASTTTTAAGNRVTSNPFVLAAASARRSTRQPDAQQEMSREAGAEVRVVPPAVSTSGFDVAAVCDAMSEDDEIPLEASAPANENSCEHDAKDELKRYKAFARRTIELEKVKLGKHAERIAISMEKQADWWEFNRDSYPILYLVWQHVASHLISSAQIERDFSACTLCLPFNRATVHPKYFQAQLMAMVNFVDLPAPHEMPQQGMSRKDVDDKLPDEGFGIPDLYKCWGQSPLQHADRGPNVESDVEDDGGCDEEGVEVTEVADVVGW